MAESRIRTVLSQFNVTRIVAVAAISALAFVPTLGAHASTTNDRVAAARQAVDDIAQRWFQAQNDAAAIDAQISDIEHRIADSQARVNATRKVATARAVMLYKSSDVALAPVFGDDALDIARRAELADQANATSQTAIDNLTSAVQDLQVQRHDLQQKRAHQQTVLAEVSKERASLDAQLASLRAQAHQEAEAALAAARSAAARRAAAARLSSFVSAAPSASDAAPTASTPPPVPVPSNPAPTGHGGVSPHHNDPFLVCTRARESGGIYTINTGNGYYGAYQFLPSTWDTVAAHAGRMDLVGVLPSNATPYDQDEIAWALYQWQGKGPWGGRC